MSDEARDIIKELEKAASSAEDAEGDAADATYFINSAISMIERLQNEIDKPKHCDKCKVLIDLRK